MRVPAQVSWLAVTAIPALNFAFTGEWYTLLGALLVGGMIAPLESFSRRKLPFRVGDLVWDGGYGWAGRVVRIGFEDGGVSGRRLYFYDGADTLRSPRAGFVCHVQPQRGPW